MISRPDHDDTANQQDAFQPIQVPVFSCVVYISKNQTGGVHARVANLSGFETDATSEREALSKLVPMFKQRVAELTASGNPIPWIEPPVAKAADEQVRLVPVHL